MPELPETLPETDAQWSPWRPRSLAVAPERRFSGGNALALAAIVAAHVGALFLLARGMAPDPADAADTSVLEVRFISKPPIEVPVPILVAPPDSDPSPSTKPLRSAASSKPARTRAVDPASTQTERKPLALVDAYGRVILPEGLVKELDAKVGDGRVFDYQVPGLATAGKVFDRPPPLVYQRNAFEDYYDPDMDLLNELLTKMVEGTTKEVRIKIPGNPGAKIVCKVSLLAMGGGCTVVQNHGNYVIQDDPETLSEEEQVQCQAWWDKIVDATSQDVWRKTRDLYERECRKPLERKPPVVPGTEPMPGRIKQ